MGNKKEKTKVMTAEGAKRLLGVITKYETTKEGDPRRGHFGDILCIALEVHAVQREDDGSLNKYGISKNAVSASFKSISADLSADVRTSFIKMLKGKIEEVLGPISAPAATLSAGQSAAAPAPAAM